MFMGEYRHSIDAKGRLIVPSKFRDQLGGEFVVTAGLDGCLFIYPQVDWNEFEKKLQALPISNPDARRFARFFLANAALCSLDSHGRILLPQNLRSLADLTGEAVFAGLGNRIEIWDAGRWTSASTYEDMDQAAAAMAGFGI